MGFQIHWTGTRRVGYIGHRLVVNVTLFLVMWTNFYHRNELCYHQKGSTPIRVDVMKNCANNVKALIDEEERHGFEGDGFSYLKNPIWWAGIMSCRCPYTHHVTITNTI